VNIDLLEYVMSMSKEEFDVWLKDELDKRVKKARTEYFCSSGDSEPDVRLTKEERIRTLSHRKWLHDRDNNRAVQFDECYKIHFSATVRGVYSDRADYKSFSKYKDAVGIYADGLIERTSLSLIGKEAEVAALRATLELLQTASE